MAGDDSTPLEIVLCSLVKYITSRFDIMPFSLPSMARGFGALLLITTVSEIMASRSEFEEQDFTWLIARNPRP